MTEEFVIGGEYFTADGQNVRLDAITTDGKYVVRMQVWEGYSDPNDSTPYADGSMQIVERLFHTPPIDKKDARIAQLEQQIRNEEIRLVQIRKEIEGAQKGHTDLIKKLEQIPALQRIADMIDGKFTHCVIENNGEFFVKTFKEAMSGLEEYERGPGLFKLICLYGNSNGDMLWKINKYRDGSGDWRHLEVCHSEEEARAALIAQVSERITKAIAQKHTWMLDRLIKSLERIGEKAPEEAVEMAAKAKIDSALLELKRRTKEFEAARDAAIAVGAIDPLVKEQP